MSENAAMRCLTVDGADLRYEIHGEGDPLVLFCGGVSPPSLDRWIAAIADYRQVIVPYDSHDRADGESLVAKRVMQLLGAMGPFGPEGSTRVDLAGWEHGGLLALYIARHYPGRVGRVVVMHPSFRLATADDVATERRLVTTPDQIECLPRVDLAQDDRAALTTDEMPARPGDEPALLNNADRLLQLERIRAPVLILGGDRGPGRVESIVELFRLFEDGHLCVEPQASAPGDRLRDMVRAVRRFLEPGAASP